MRKKSFPLFDTLNVTFLSLFSLAVLYPFWQTLVLSFSDANNASTLGFHLWPDQWVTDAYQFVFTFQNIMVAYSNTIIRTVIGTALIVTCTLLTAYPLSKKDLPYRNYFTAFFLIAMFFSGGLIPNYLLIKSLGLLDNRLALILPGAVNVFSIIIMRNYLMTIDKGLEESAFMDGAGYFKILTSIVIPLSKPVIATVALWAAVGHWNAWFDAMIYIRDPSKTVLQMVVRQMMVALDLSQTQFGGGGMSNANLLLSNVRAATVMISIGPIILIYPFAQKYFIKGIMIGSLKG
ncbi:sugar ABC transporter permease [Gordoniibacillus kamchatkensis]|uniref:Sugar ABC transporter permease n=1 Tax=Gordoniibacillus kamchatkensis TaxID=1590651 RepID=A0ABR5ALP7_9BACL|nr:carbohydrate ABC transporter permease [Paenibacillus sp. VKM B-2647]KIL41972.1 sugar ABC transporter permease [Paenibacillus sp. VKM B-2647]